MQKKLSMKNIGILVFDNVELLDFAGPFQVFSASNTCSTKKHFNILTVASSLSHIKTSNGLEIVPQYAIDQHPDIDILVIPGGDGTKSLLNKKQLLDWLRSIIQGTIITLSVCSGARILAKLGLLKNLEFTTHQEVVEDVLTIEPKAVYDKNKRFVDNGKIMTSAGISTGIDLALHIVEKLHGISLKKAVMDYMAYKLPQIHNNKELKTNETSSCLSKANKQESKN